MLSAMRRAVGEVDRETPPCSTATRRAGSSKAPAGLLLGHAGAEEPHVGPLVPESEESLGQHTRTISGVVADAPCIGRRRAGLNREQPGAAASIRAGSSPREEDRGDIARMRSPESGASCGASDPQIDYRPCGAASPRRADRGGGGLGLCDQSRRAVAPFGDTAPAFGPGFARKPCPSSWSGGSAQRVFGVPCAVGRRRGLRGLPAAAQQCPRADAGDEHGHGRTDEPVGRGRRAGRNGLDAGRRCEPDATSAHLRPGR